METKALGPEDIDLLLAVGPGLFDNPVDPVQAAAFLDNQLNRIVLAFATGQAVAFASGTILLHPDKAPSMLVNEVGTHDAFQRRGYASAVCRHLIAQARDLGCKGIWLATEPDNAAALGLYRKLRGEEAALVGFAWDDAFGTG